ncbi:glycosyltransferase [Oenococcus alcoholitolerans]|uniref:glycosyltransferase n=1 Tax=Oenococcus alcoholitolerans TaxID=931074 RepID=UPI003F71E277
MNYYFISDDLYTFNSGTEFSQAQRTELFNRFNKKAFYVTKNYNSQLHLNAFQLGLDDRYLIGMYDFFQKSLSTPSHKMNLRYLNAIPKDDYKIESPSPDFSLLKEAGKIIGRIKVIPSTVSLVDQVEYFDDFGKVIARDHYDWRGFLSSTEYFDQEQMPIAQVFFTPAGKKVLEITKRESNRQIYINSIRLYDFAGQDFYFSSEDELFIFFLNHLLEEKPGLIINDRTDLIAAIASVNATDLKYQYLHDPQTYNSFDPINGQMVTGVDSLFDTFKMDFSGVIVASQKQKNTLKQRFPSANIIKAPDTVIFSHPDHFLKKVHPQRVLWFGHISAEKNLEDMIAIAKIVTEKKPETVFEIYGYYFSKNYYDKLTTLVENYGLKSNVIFSNYQQPNELKKTIFESSLYLQTSMRESFGISLIQAMSFGLPAIAYNIDFGPSEIISDQKNGFLIKAGDKKSAAEKIIEVLNDESLYQKISKEAFKTADLFGPEKTWQNWLKTGLIK